jgi:hypothetical protein
MNKGRWNIHNKSSLTILEIHCPGKQPRFNRKHIPTSVFCKYMYSNCLFHIIIVLKQEHPAVAGGHLFGLIILWVAHHTGPGCV